MIPAMSVPGFVLEDLEQLQLEVPPEVLLMLSQYLDRLLEANQRMNLTAIRERDAAWRRMIIDSMTILPWLDALSEDSRVADVGSGGGLPGMVVAICRGDLKVSLIEATGKKASFLRETAESLALPHVQVCHDRAESIGHQPQHRGQYDVVMSRAVGHLSPVLEWSMPLLKEGGSVLAMKGPKVEQELAACGDALAQLGAGEVEVYDAYPESFDNNLLVVQVVKDRATPQAFPREPGVAKRQHL